MREVLLSTILLLVISGCEQSKTNHRDQSVPYGVALDEKPAGGSWSPESMVLTCASGQCPDQVGILIFVFPAKNNRHDIRRCTAFLVGSDRVMSNGHCDYSDRATGYFVTAESSAAGRQVRQVSRVISKWFTPEFGSKALDSGRPDAAIFELEKPMPKIVPLKLARPSDPVFSELHGYVINSLAADRYVIEKVSCVVRRHEAAFPFDLNENPDVIRAFDCATKPGNSGAPFFAPGSEVVQVIGQGSSNKELLARETRARFNRELFTFEGRDSITATNVRCLKASQGTCVRATDGEINDRFAQFQQSYVTALMNRSLEDQIAGDLRYQPLGQYQLTSSTADGLQFEVVYWPRCRLTRKIPAVIQFPSELVRLKFNEWAEVSTERVELSFSSATLAKNAKDRIQLQTNWFSGFGPLSYPSEHPRQSRGSTFSIDLPPCPR